MVDHFGDFTFVLQMAYGICHIKKCNLSPTFLSVAYFWTLRKVSKLFFNNVIAMTFWFQYD